MNTITLNIYRFNKETVSPSILQPFTLSYSNEETLLDLLMRVLYEFDSTLAFDKNCRIGLCGSCRLKVNGKVMLACSENVAKLVSEFGNELEITPYNCTKVVRDLIVEPQFENCSEIEVKK
ncbi:2Fe-2S iron-sulfur cluster-binding protein [Pseudoalteromonas sp. D15MCD-2]|jgi:succinate dehydrogenase / fumarate reductase iron-sulfur subunit